MSDELSEIPHRLHAGEQGFTVCDECGDAADAECLGVPLVGKDARLELTTLEQSASR